MRWSDIARSLGVSESSTLYQFGMPVEGREFSNIYDQQLDDFIARILQATPAVGVRMIMGSLRHHGYTVYKGIAYYILYEGNVKKIQSEQIKYFAKLSYLIILDI